LRERGSFAVFSLSNLGCLNKGFVPGATEGEFGGELGEKKFFFAIVGVGDILERKLRSAGGLGGV